jgi:hypothetical protein
MKFEVHITGEPSIIEEFDKLGIKSIKVELISPENKVMQVEHMSSFVVNYDNIIDFSFYLQDLIYTIKSKIIRIKVEIPGFHREFDQQALYIESHFNPINSIYPISQNLNSGKLLGTAREVNKDKFNLFRSIWRDKEIELCIYDTNINFDLEWFKSYKK